MQPGEAEAPPAIEDIVRGARGEVAEAEALRAEYQHLRGTVGGEDWQGRKHKALSAMSAPDFWSSPRRFAVMGLAEHMDRIEVGMDTAGSLLDRLARGTRNHRGHAPSHLVRRLAQQLYLIGLAVEGIAAGMPRDAFVRVSAAQDPGVDAAAADAFARRLAGMYRSWADNRRMRLELLEEHPAGPYSVTLAVSGFAAYPILAGEHGQHVLELPAEGRTFTRVRVLVLVAPQPDEPPSGELTPQRQAALALDEAGHGRAVVVRRYRDEPSPLVRDSVRGWRTGRVDHVMDGDFDLLG